MRRGGGRRRIRRETTSKRYLVLVGDVIFIIGILKCAKNNQMKIILSMKSADVFFLFYIIIFMGIFLFFYFYFFSLRGVKLVSIVSIGIRLQLEQRGGNRPTPSSWALVKLPPITITSSVRLITAQ